MYRVCRGGEWREEGGKSDCEVRGAENFVISGQKQMGGFVFLNFIVLDFMKNVKRNGSLSKVS